MDSSGAWKLEPRFATLTSFSEQGLAIASLPEDTANKKLRIVEMSGKAVAEISGTLARGFYEGKAAVFNKTWSYVDTAGTLLWGGFTSASDYSAQKAVVKTGAKQWAILNSDGQKLESGTWTQVLLGKDGIVIFCNAVKSKPSQTLCYFHDANGIKQTFPIGDELTSSFENGLASFTRNGLSGFYAHVNSAQAAR